MSVLLCGALSRLQIFGNQFVGEYKLRFGYPLEREADARALGFHRDFGSIETQKPAAKTLSAVQWCHELDLGLVARITREIHQPRQRTVDTGRRHFEFVLALDRVFRLDEVQQRVAERRAILHIHRSVRALRHDLQRLCLSAHQPEAHEPVACSLDDGLKDRLQMRHRRENGGSSLLAGRVKSGHGQSLFPRGGLSTTTQQYVLLFGMAAMYAPETRISRLWRWLFCLGRNENPHFPTFQMHRHLG